MYNPDDGGPDTGGRIVPDIPPGITPGVDLTANDIVSIYDLDEDETDFHNRFPDPDTAALYRQFAIGLSIVDPEWDTRWAWNRAAIYLDLVMDFVNLAQLFPDPRLIYDLDGEEQAYIVNFTPERKREYVHYRMGHRLQDMNVTTATIIRAHYSGDPDMGARVAQGRAHYGDPRVPEARPPPVHIPSPTDHVHGARGVHPPPTANDIREVHRALAEVGKGGEWKYVNTICLHVQHGWFTRIVHLFVCLDDDDNIKERIIVKIQGERTHDQARESADREYSYQERVSNRGCDYILDAYACSVRHRPVPPHLLYIIMDYAGFGDLHALVSRQRDTGRQLPEAFIWIVFRGLAEALYMLLSGKAITIDQPDEASAKIKDPAVRVQARVDGWQPIVNMDIKLANVVLTEPGPTFPAYKTPKMIDFGICVDTGTVVERHTRERGVGTPGWRPPELYEITGDQQQSQRYYNNDVNNRIDAKSDIFNVGLIILNMMDPVAVRAVWNYGNIRVNIRHSRGYSYSYSQPLEDLVTQCLKNDRKQRPDVMDILYRTRKGLEGWQDATVPFMRVPSDQVPAFMKVAVFQEDSFQTGTLAPERLRKRRAPVEDAQDGTSTEESLRLRRPGGLRLPGRPPERAAPPDEDEDDNEDDDEGEDPNAHEGGHDSDSDSDSDDGGTPPDSDCRPLYQDNLPPPPPAPITKRRRHG